MSNFYSDLHSREASTRAAAAREAGAVQALDAEDALRILVNDESPVVLSRGGRIGVGEVRFAALTALQSIFLAHGKPIDLGEVRVRKWMLEDEVLERLAAVSSSDKERVAAQVEATLQE